MFKEKKQVLSPFILSLVRTQHAGDPSHMEMYVVNFQHRSFRYQFGLLECMWLIVHNATTSAPPMSVCSALVQSMNNLWLHLERAYLLGVVIHFMSVVCQGLRIYASRSK
jgi:hypothetical protein